MPPAETSPHPRRRPLGRGPGTPARPGAGEGRPPELPADPEPAASDEAVEGAPPEAPQPEPPPEAASHEATAEPPGPAAPATDERPPPGTAEQPGTAASEPGGAEPSRPRAEGRVAVPDTSAEPVSAEPVSAGPASDTPAAPSVVPGPPAEPVAGLPVPGDAGDAPGETGRFTVRLGNFEGPFDLLLQLISKHKLDVTEVALSRVTDEFMAYIRGMGPDWDLDQATEFLVVAATLLDLKAARLLPAAEVEDEADLALLEARDLLFARLLQYRAYKEIAGILAERWESEGRRYPRTVGLEPHHAELLPEVVISIGPEGFAKLAVKAMQPKAKPQVYVDHIHAPLVSVREQAGVVVALLKARGTLSFRELAEDADDTLTVVARFLALLELYREKAVALDQPEALGDLTVSWTGGDGDTRVTDEFDQVTEAME
ncbi:segregation/condensation protein A [Streptomyces sp. HUAS MG47]|uniref:segregation and condensation protein A n=1 Tax=Streptomyces solicamelliae TaxID=3231716 RepID=UPI003877E49E